MIRPDLGFGNITNKRDRTHTACLVALLFFSGAACNDYRFRHPMNCDKGHMRLGVLNRLRAAWTTERLRRVAANLRGRHDINAKASHPLYVLCRTPLSPTAPPGKMLSTGWLWRLLLCYCIPIHALTISQPANIGNDIYCDAHRYGYPSLESCQQALQNIPDTHHSITFGTRPLTPAIQVTLPYRFISRKYH